MNNIGDYKEQAEHYKKRIEDCVEHNKQKKRDNAQVGQILIVLCTLIIIATFIPGNGIEDRGATFSLAFAGVIGGVIMWLKGKD